MPPEQRVVVRLLTVVAVFVIVALVTFEPAIFALPGLVAIACLGIFDYLVVTTRQLAPRPGGRDAARYGGPPGAGPRTVDPNAPTTSVPRLEYPTSILAAPRPQRPPSPAAGSPPAPAPGAGTAGRRPPEDTVADLSPVPDNVDIATMAIDMRAYLDL